MNEIVAQRGWVPPPSNERILCFRSLAIHEQLALHIYYLIPSRKIENSDGNKPPFYINTYVLHQLNARA
jgi:hypothetical protein